MLIPLVSISCAAFKQSSHIQSVIELIFATLFSALQLFFFFIGWICRLIWNYWCIDYFPIHCFNWQSVPKLWKMWNCQCRALHSVCNWLILVTRLIQSVWNVWTIQWQSYQSIQSNDVKINSFLLEGIFTRVSSKTKHQVSKLLCSQIHNGIEQIRNYQKLLLLWWWFFFPSLIIDSSSMALNGSDESTWSNDRKINLAALDQSSFACVYVAYVFKTNTEAFRVIIQVEM